jgi:hypothetical protein
MWRNDFFYPCLIFRSWCKLRVVQKSKQFDLKSSSHRVENVPLRFIIDFPIYRDKLSSKKAAFPNSLSERQKK